MQYNFSLTPTSLAAIRRAMSEARFLRFLNLAGGDQQYAMKLYLWNAKLCQSFQLPMQFTEVSLRNAVVKPILRRFGDTWYADHRFRAILKAHVLAKLLETIEREENLRGGECHGDRIIAALPLNFWCSMLTASYQSHLWAVGLQRSFPNAPADVRLIDIMKLAEGFRQFRNKIAHHYCIADQTPRKEYGKMMRLVGYICEDTKWLCERYSEVIQIISAKPRP